MVKEGGGGVQCSVFGEERNSWLGPLHFFLNTEH